MEETSNRGHTIPSHSPPSIMNPEDHPAVRLSWCQNGGERGGGGAGGGRVSIRKRREREGDQRSCLRTGT